MKGFALQIYEKIRGSVHSPALFSHSLKTKGGIISPLPLLPFSFVPLSESKKKSPLPHGRELNIKNFIL